LAGNGGPYTKTKTTVAPIIGLKHGPVQNTHQISGHDSGLYRNAIGATVENDKTVARGRNTARVSDTPKVVTTTNGTGVGRPNYGASLIGTPGKNATGNLSGNNFPPKHP
jgi:hypothetical protein